MIGPLQMVNHRIGHYHFLSRVLPRGTYFAAAVPPPTDTRDHVSRRRRRRGIATRISPTATMLRSETSDNEVYLVGTAHVSERSADEVREMIRLVRPDGGVFVELCPARAAKLRSGDAGDDGGSTNDDLERSLRAALASGKIPGLGGVGGGGEAMLGAALSGFYSMLKRCFGFDPGVEMKAAMDEAEASGARLHFGDRDVQETMRGLTGALNVSAMIRAMNTPVPAELEGILGTVARGGGEGLAEGVELLKTRERAGMMTDWIKKALPEVAEVLIFERDRIMARNLRVRCGKGKVVAVVGMAHVDGIEREWERLDASS